MRTAASRSKRGFVVALGIAFIACNADRHLIKPMYWGSLGDEPLALRRIGQAN